jgi:hypothetical protein
LLTIYIQIYIPDNKDAAGESVILKLGDLFGEKGSQMPDNDEILDLWIENLREDSIEAIRSSKLNLPDEDSVQQFLSTRQAAGENVGGGKSVNCRNVSGSHNTNTDNSKHYTIHNNYQFVGLLDLKRVFGDGMTDGFRSPRVW